MPYTVTTTRRIWPNPNAADMQLDVSHRTFATLEEAQEHVRLAVSVDDVADLGNAIVLPDRTKIEIERA